MDLGLKSNLDVKIQIQSQPQRVTLASVAAALLLHLLLLLLLLHLGHHLVLTHAVHLLAALIPLHHLVVLVLPVAAVRALWWRAGLFRRVLFRLGLVDLLLRLARWATGRSARLAACLALLRGRHIYLLCVVLICLGEGGYQNREKKGIASQDVKGQEPLFDTGTWS